MKTIAVFFGGVSVEHDVSIITGVLTLNSIDKERYSAVPVYVDKTGQWYTGEQLNDVDNFKNLNYKKLSKVLLVPGCNTLYKQKKNKLLPLCNVAVAVNCMHGERGEDGCLIGLLKLSFVPLASPDLLASAVCMDKSFTKIFLKGLKIKALPSVTVDSDWKESDLENKEFPLIVKPCCLGSSIGVQLANNSEELTEAISNALRYGERAILEPCISDFTEINCAVYRTKEGEIITSECEKPVGRTKFLSFEDKYQQGDRIFPADISKKLSDKIKQISIKIYKNLYIEGIIRIDFFIVGKEIYVNEINTVPGSLAYYLFCDTQKGFSKLLTDLICRAEENFSRQQSVNKCFKTSILDMVGCKGKNSCKK